MFCLPKTAWPPTCSSADRGRTPTLTRQDMGKAKNTRTAGARESGKGRAFLDEIR